MATYYVKSGATGTADGLSWANAFLTLGAAAAVDVAGDTIYVSQSHAETAAVALTWAFAGTQINPTKIICVNDSVETPTTLASTGSITTTGGNGQNVQGSVYFSGINFVSAGTFGSQQSSGSATYENCTFYIPTNTSALYFLFGNNAGTNNGRVVLDECSFRFSNAGQGFYFGSIDAVVKNSSLHASSAGLTLLVPTWGPGRSSGDVIFDGCDLSTMGASASFTSSAAASPNTMTIRNCKLPSGWNGRLYSSDPSSTGTDIQMFNCDSTDTNYRLFTEHATGSVKTETGVTRTGGANNGTTPLSWRLAATTNAKYPFLALQSPEIVVWNDTTGTPKTVTVEVLTDGITLKDDECWLEIQYLGTSGFPLGSFANDAKADILATPVNQPTSTETWVNEGVATPVKQKLQVTFTPQEKGFVHAKVMLARPNTTVYVCPKASVI